MTPTKYFNVACLVYILGVGGFTLLTTSCGRSTDSSESVPNARFTTTDIHVYCAMGGVILTDTQTGTEYLCLYHGGIVRLDKPLSDERPYPPR